MSITISIPSVLRHECQGKAALVASATSVREALRLLEQDHPALYRSICDETGAVRQHVNLFVNDLFLHEREGLETSLAEGDVLTIMPAVSGG